MAFSRLDEEHITVGLVTGGHYLSHFYILALPPLFPALRTEFGLSNAQLGLLVAVLSAVMLIQVLVGEVVDLVGAKRVFVGGVAVTSLGIFLAGTASSYPLLLVAAAVSGLGQSAFHPADYPLLETVSDDDRVGKNFSIHTFGGYAGFATAPLVVGTLGAAYGWQAALLGVGAVGLCYAIGAAVVLQPVYRRNLEATSEETDGRRTTSRDVFLRPGILVMAAFFVLVAMASKGIQTFTPILAIDGFRLTEAIGNSALSGFFALTAVGVLVGGVLADRYDPKYVIVGATATAAVSLLAVVGDVVSIHRTTFVALFGLSGGAYGLAFASRDRLVSTYSAAESTGRSFGFVFTLSSLGSLVSPVVLGLLIDASAVSVAFVVISGFFFLSGVVVLTIGLGRLSWVARFPSR